MRSFCLSLGCYNKVSLTKWFINNRNSLLVWDQDVSTVSSGERLLSFCIFGGKREGENFLGSFL